MKKEVYFLLKNSEGKEKEKRCLITLDASAFTDKSICSAIVQFVDLYNRGYREFYCISNSQYELDFLGCILAICQKKEFKDATIYPVVLDNKIDATWNERFATNHIKPIFLNTACLQDIGSSFLKVVPAQVIVSFPGSDESFSRKIIDWAIRANWSQVQNI